MKTNKTLYFKPLPLRGEVNLQSDPNLACFLATFLGVVGRGGRLRGNFGLKTYPECFINSLKDSGFVVGVSPDFIDISEEQDCYDSCFLDNCDILGFYKILLILSKKGLVEIKGNRDFVGLFKYMGYQVESKENSVEVLFNKVVEEKNALTFHETNLTYFFVSILLFLLSSREFSISIPEINYEINLIIDLFKEFGFIKDVSYGNFVTIRFNFEGLNSKNFFEFDIPKDSEEMVFWSFAALVTSGEIRITGLSSNTIISTLKILSDIGAGFESLNDTSIKVWGKILNQNLNSMLISQDSNYLVLTKLCLLSSLSTLDLEGNKLSIKLNSNDFKSLILDFNRLGSSININNDTEILIQGGKTRQGVVYLTEGSEELSYAYLLYCLASGGKVGISNIENLTFYNESILNKLTNLGGSIVTI